MGSSSCVLAVNSLADGEPCGPLQRRIAATQPTLWVVVDCPGIVARESDTNYQSRDEPEQV